VIQEYFETYVLSFEVGAAKPGREIFERATKEADVEPAETFFVDDRPEHVAGAREYGWQAEVYTTPTQLAADLRRRGLSINY
jgi:HAD superfamily hydrolase (TIGR01509 family)